jgi:hypothetical protein
MEKENPNYYAVLSADVRYDKKISSSAKLLYAEITALCNKSGFCWAGNRYFSELYRVSARSIQSWLKQLIKGGYIRCEMVDLSKRRIFLVRGGMKKTSGGDEENFALNNTINTTADKKEGFSKEKHLLKVIKTKKMDNDIVEVDDEGRERVNAWGKRKGAPKREPKNKLALALQHHFIEQAYRSCGTRPILDIKGYKMVLYSMNTGGLSKEQVLDLFDWWFSLGRPDNESIQITRALSANNINSYKIANGIK